MHWTRIFAQSEPGARKTKLGAQTGACGNKQNQKEEQIEPFTRKQRFRADMAFIQRNWNPHQTGQKMLILGVKLNYFSNMQKTAVICATVWRVSDRDYNSSSYTLTFNDQREILAISSQVPLLLSHHSLTLFSVTSQFFLLFFPRQICILQRVPIQYLL